MKPSSNEVRFAYPETTKSQNKAPLFHKLQHIVKAHLKVLYLRFHKVFRVPSPTPFFPRRFTQHPNNNSRNFNNPYNLNKLIPRSPLPHITLSTFTHYSLISSPFPQSSTFSTLLTLSIITLAIIIITLSLILYLTAIIAVSPSPPSSPSPSSSPFPS